MSCQIFLFSPKFNKKPIYNSPANKYQEFSNAFVYSIMVMTGNGTLNRADVCREAMQEWNKIKKKSTTEIDKIIKKFLNTQFSLYDIQIMRLRNPAPREPREDLTLLFLLFIQKDLHRKFLLMQQLKKRHQMKSQ
ncbi:hypothetical protein RhiirA1_446302 [Rhizophagus irregularis]|uniref:Uncharacterized protein n=1 Tax=Rhizophagus irregularis TaxID=588596 RepID=A0A2N0R1E4_9GLOM|nr:hypothetical protein RhiirA1_446302 [Rhizophagus irregularis]CAB4473731.1 unnamed protein product [Rhizophagus irregularis]